MLLGQDLGRYHQRSLIPGFGSQIHRDRGDDRLAGADIALYEALHRCIAGEIVDQLGDDTLLRAGQRERQRRHEAVDCRAARGQCRCLLARGPAATAFQTETLRHQFLEREPPDPGMPPGFEIAHRRAGRWPVNESQGLLERRPFGSDQVSEQIVGTSVDLKRLRDENDPYNSRYQKGLPPTPIGAPTVSSLVAAMKPTKSPYWYYLHDSERKLHPAGNGAEHDALGAKEKVD